MRKQQKEVYVPEHIKLEARRLATEYSRADRNRCASDAVKIIDAIRHLGYEVFAEIPGVLRCKYIGGTRVQVRGM